jgi:hypothetical protein
MNFMNQVMMDQIAAFLRSTIYNAKEASVDQDTISLL